MLKVDNCLTNDVYEKSTDGSMFCCHGYVKFGPQYCFMFLNVLTNYVLYCKYPHLIFCHKKICSKIGVLDVLDVCKTV